MLVYEFCPINDNQDGYQNGYPLFVAVHYAVPFVGVCSSFNLVLGLEHYNIGLRTLSYIYYEKQLRDI